MPPLLLALIALLSVIALIGVLGRRLWIPPPVLLALAGVALGALSFLPRIPLEPKLILVLFLPPLLYADAFDTSWVDFRRWMRPILMLAVGLVAATIVAVGIVAHLVLPELPWPACFTLGAIVSPTDTIAVQAVIERLRVPRRITAILGGESLVNDATGLVGVQLGVAVLASGAFEARTVVSSFLWVAIGGVVVGLASGYAFTWLNRIVRDTKSLFVISVLAPYVAFVGAEHFHTSGVLAVVTAGLIVSWNIHWIPAQARVDLYAAWDLVTYVLGAMCFVFVGLETPYLLGESDVAGNGRLVGAGLLVALAAIALRVLWIFPGAYLPLWISPRLRRHEGGYARWQHVLLVGWCGVRGFVSLAAALALPFTLDDGRPFPGREEILFCTLCVILVTLVLQAPTLVPLIRLLGIREDEDSESDVHAAREGLLAAGIARLDEFCSETSCPVSVHHWRTHMADELASLRDDDEHRRELARTRLQVSADVRRAVFEAQSSELLRMRDEGRINDATYLELQLDLDRVQGARAQASA